MVDTSHPHVLHFRYPACELLCQDGNLPFLSEPAFAEYRVRPIKDGTLQRSFGTDFHVVLSSSLDEQVYSSLPNLGPLFHVINQLYSVPGESELQYVEGRLALDDEYWRHAFRLVTVQDGVNVNTQEWTLVSAEVMQLEEPQYRDVPWIAMFLHLIERKSDMACYHVEQQMLNHFDSGQVEAEIEQHPWGFRRFWTAHQYFLARVVLQNFGYALRDLPVVALPCSDFVPSTWQGFERTGLDEILALRCPKCDKRLLDDTETEEVKACHENTNTRGAFVEMNSQWSTLDSEPSSFEVISVHPKALGAAVELALASLQPPSLILPAAMSMAAMEETTEIKKQLRVLCSGSKLPLAVAPAELVNILQQQISDRTLQQSFLRPGYVAFVHKWCCRAVSFLVHFRCDEAGPQHVGLHLHGSLQVYNPAGWTTIDELDAGLHKLAIEKACVEVIIDQDMDL